MAIDTTSLRTRRALLMGTLGGAAALVAGALGRPPIGQAADGDAIHVGDSVSGTTTTSIATTAKAGLQIRTSDPTGIALTGWAVTAGDTAEGVHGETASVRGFGVVGVATAATGKSNGVFGQNASSDGTGVTGFATASNGATVGVAGLADSPDGMGVFGSSTATTGTTAGVLGRTQSPDGTGVVGLGLADGGRGGYFSGSAAQIRLVPALTSHPKSGRQGDLFVDKNGHLWFCKGDTNWKQLA